MSDRFIIDAHAHFGAPGVFFTPRSLAEELLRVMDRSGVRFAICCDHVSVYNGCGAGLESHRKTYEESGGRIHYLGVFNPHRSAPCMAALERARDWPGFVGLKIHPSLHGIEAESPSYEAAWRFAAENDLPILTHSWSVSGHNPFQRLSTPERFEVWVKRFPNVRFVLGHAGGRGGGRHEAVRMANSYPNVFLDIAGDIFDYRLIESLVASIPVEKILFGSDYPWLDLRSRLSHVLLAEVDAAARTKILCENAGRVYTRIGEKRC